MHIPEVPGHPPTPNIPSFRQPIYGGSPPLRPPQPGHPAHLPGTSETLAPPDDVQPRPPIRSRTQHLLGAIGVPQAAAHEPTDKSPPVAEVPAEVAAPATGASEPMQTDKPTAASTPEKLRATTNVPPPVPDDIRHAVAGIVQNRISASHEWASPEDLALSLTYGPPEEKESVLALAEGEAALATAIYAEEIATFVGSAPDTGITTGRFDGYSKHYVATYPHTRDACRKWLAVTADHSPEAGAEALDTIVQTLKENFDAEQFAQAIRVADDPESREWEVTVTGMEHAARQLTEELAHTMSAHARDPEILEEFLSTTFVQEYGSELTKNIVDRRMIDLDGSFDPTNLHHAEVAATTKRIVSEGTYPFIRQELHWLLLNDPEGALDALPAFSRSSIELERAAHEFISNINPAERTESQRSVLHAIEERENADTLRATYKLTRQLTASGSITPDDARELVRVALDESEFVSVRPQKLVCAFLPLDELTEVVANASSKIPSSAILSRALAVRRYAAAGQLDMAYDLAEGRYGGTTKRDKAKNLLAIYDETNDTRSLDAAKGILTALADQEALLHSDMYDSLLSQHMTARKYGDQERQEATWREMETYLGPNIYVYAPNYERLILAHLDVGNVQQAETHALQFKERLAADGIQKIRGADTTFLNVAYAYQQQGRYDEVARIVRTHFLSPGIDRDTFTQALGLLKGDRLDRATEMHAPNINAFHELLRPY